MKVFLSGIMSVTRLLTADVQAARQDAEYPVRAVSSMVHKSRSMAINSRVGSDRDPHHGSVQVPGNRDSLVVGPVAGLHQIAKIDPRQ